MVYCCFFLFSVATVTLKILKILNPNLMELAQSMHGYLKFLFMFILFFYVINFIGLPKGNVQTGPGVPCKAPPN